MKKLMIAACAAAMAMGANAATYDKWTCDASSTTLKTPVSIKDGYNAKTIGGTSENPVGAGLNAYYYASAHPMFIGVPGFLESLRAGKSVQEAFKDNNLTLLATTTTDSSGYLTLTTCDVDTGLYVDIGVGIPCLSWGVVVVGDNDNVYIGSGNLHPSSSLRMTSGATYSKYLRDNNGTVAYSDGGWYSTASVPEPTSGLLMLVGGMLLGLRRKRV